MDKAQVLKVLDIYEKKLKELNAEPKEYPHERIMTPNSKIAVMDHCYSMISPMRKMVNEGKMEKVFRWLGFIQSSFWNYAIYTMVELRDHNR